MRRAIKGVLLAAVVALVCAPVQARAEGYVSPWAGVNFGNDQAEGDWSFGANAGYMGGGIIGAELDFGYAPDFFGESVDNYVLDLMGNIIVGIPVGGTAGPGIRPYVTGGLGLLRTSVDPGNGLDSITTNDFGYNLGAGVMGYFSDHVGLRGDVRYLRTINADEEDNVFGLDIGLGTFHFWRASIGLVIR